MVKLDRTFVENVTDSAFDAAVVRAVSDMAETIGIGVVAEGVETDEQVRLARDLGCGYAQGFHFAEPVPASSVERLLARPMPVST
jgi:EAL domain-containing protein (putative c-di-GMP-specific phosphodiesterase class I)